jgi:hypothetical protein
MKIVYRACLGGLLTVLAAGPALSAPCAVLVHGLGRSSLSMALIAGDLSALGYVVVNRGYPSRRQSIEASAAVVGQGVAACRAKGAAPIDFVTHSQGGIVLRQYFQDHAVPEARRAVMLAPPNHGSEIVDNLSGRWWYDLATGPAGQTLGAKGDSLPSRLGAMPLSVGVIAGTLSAEPWFSRYFNGPNDGKVSVESARLDGMRDFITVRASHTFMMNSPKVRGQIAAFLSEGQFRR